MARATAADLSMLARLRAGDESALIELVYRYQPALLRLALVFVPNRALAAEVVQETWTGMLEGIAHFEGQCRINTWIFGILIQRARRRAIRASRPVPVSALRHSEWEIESAIDLARLHLDGGSADSRSDRHDGTAERLIGRGAMDCLKLALHRLPPHLRAVVTLRDIEGLDSGEVCRLLGISEANQEVGLQRARSRLRRALDKHLAGVQAVVGRRSAKG
jgi:RNA polymerase sigma-70 factor (ECF subfamily)